MELDDTVCYCFHISKRKVLNHLRIFTPRRASQLSECGGAGTGCGWCVAYLQKYFQESRGENTADGPQELSPADYSRMRAGYIRSGKGTPASGAIPLPTDET